MVVRMLSNFKLEPGGLMLHMRESTIGIQEPRLAILSVDFLVAVAGLIT